MEKPELIYCANGNGRFAEIAINSGFTYGAQMPGTVYFQPEFIDQNWKKPDRQRYMADLAMHGPRIATVLDLEREEQYSEVMEWAEEAAQHVTETVIIIPKVFGIIPRIPETVGGKEVRLGYSVPTKHGGTQLPVWEFFGRDVHLLGGSPHAQMRIAAIAGMRVTSVDGNMMHKMAARYCQFWTPGNSRYASNRWWPTIKELRGERSEYDDLIYEVFEMSCRNIVAAWNAL